MKPANILNKREENKRTIYNNHVEDYISNVVWIWNKIQTYMGNNIDILTLSSSETLTFQLIKHIENKIQHEKF